MRSTPTLKLSTRLVAFLTVIVTGAMLILFIGGTLSFQRLGQEYMYHYLDRVVEVIDNELAADDAPYRMKSWVPQLLYASDIVDMRLSLDKATIYRYQQATELPKLEDIKLFDIHRPLPNHPRYQLDFRVIPPYIGFTYSIGAMWSITLAVCLIAFCLWRGVKWLQMQLLGSELLEERGRMILAGRVEQYAQGHVREWPYTASEALDKLIAELQDARHERSRFDAFIRSQTFLDPLTGMANRILFDSKLEAAVSEKGALGHLLLLHISVPSGDESCAEEYDALLVEVGKTLSNLCHRYSEVILSRYYTYTFAVLFSRSNFHTVSQIALQCLKLFKGFQVPSTLSSKNWHHMGLASFQEGQSPEQVFEAAELALKSAQLEEVNSWSHAPEMSKLLDDTRSNVRWRTLFEQRLHVDKIHLFQNPCFWVDRYGRRSYFQYDLLPRLPDENHRLIDPTELNSALMAVGYESIWDRVVWQRVVQLLKFKESEETHYAIRLYVTPFERREQFIWLRNALMTLPHRLREKLTFEFTERSFVKGLDFMRPVVKLITACGARVNITHVGRTIVSTHYLKELNIHSLKLHRSLAKKIMYRHENQLLIRSLIGVCHGSETKLIAVNVETKEEWQTLRTLGVDGGQGTWFEEPSQVMPLRPQRGRHFVKPGPRRRWKTNTTKRDSSL